MMRWLLSLAVGAIMAGMTAEGHHSIAAVYDSSREATIEATVSQFHFVQPHPYLVVEVRRGGSTERWQLEMDNRWELADIGFTDGTLKSGDRVVVTGSLARREGRRMYIRRLDRPADGFAYEQVGSRPQIRPGR